VAYGEAARYYEEEEGYERAEYDEPVVYGLVKGQGQGAIP
jgi:hypothetical protein